MYSIQASLIPSLLAFFFFVLNRPEFTGERIPTLSEAVDLCEELDLLIFLDVKGDTTKVFTIICIPLHGYVLFYFLFSL